MLRVGVDDPDMAGRALASVRRPERSVGHAAQDGDGPLVTSERASVAAGPPGPNGQEHQAHSAKDDQEGHDESTRPHRCHCETRSAAHAPCLGPPFRRALFARGSFCVIFEMLLARNLVVRSRAPAARGHRREGAAIELRKAHCTHQQIADALG